MIICARAVHSHVFRVDQIRTDLIHAVIHVIPRFGILAFVIEWPTLSS